MSRVVLVSGKGGVGKTTVAAATAVTAAKRGHRALAVSLDRAHNLGDVLGVQLGPDPTKLTSRLSALEADPQVELRNQWGTLSGYFARLLEWAGVASAQADEIAVFPGLEELLVLSRLTELVDSAEYDVVVVDLAPTASSLRLLSFPELMSGPIGSLVRFERGFMKLARPAARRVLSVPLPEDEVYEAMQAIAERLRRLRDLLLDPARAVVRLVSIPERVVIRETESAFTLLGLFGLCVDMVVLNRVLPADATQGYFDTWGKIQQRELERAQEHFSGVPLSLLSFQRDEVIGTRALAAVGRELYRDRDPGAAFVDVPPVRFSDAGSGETTMELRLPHAEGRKLDLKQRGDDLIVTVEGWRRTVALPASLRGRVVGSARFSAGSLFVHFSKGDAS
jgi:arsenite-transporting ATPase